MAGLRSDNGSRGSVRTLCWAEFGSLTGVPAARTGASRPDPRRKDRARPIPTARLAACRIVVERNRKCMSAPGSAAQATSAKQHWNAVNSPGTPDAPFDDRRGSPEGPARVNLADTCGIDRVDAPDVGCRRCRSESAEPRHEVSMGFRCLVCGYIHEGSEPPDTCAVCGAGREQFVPMAAETRAPAALSAGAAVPESAAGIRWLVLGGGIAGLQAIEASREANPDALLTLVHREPSLPYDRLNLTRYLAGDAERDQLLIRSAAWFEERHIHLVCAEARCLDLTRQLAVLDNGQEIRYDRLVIATGSHAFVPPILGVRRNGVYVLRTLADADAILECARRGARCVCIGGGLLGLEIAGGLAGRGLDVAVLDEAPWLLSRQLAHSAAARLASHLGERGIAIRTGATTAEIAGDESVRAVRLADGTEVPADLVVLAAGVRPNVALARSAGLAVNRGIVVDESLRTSDPRVFAAGDVAEYRGVTWGLWTVALEQGRLAGRALAGQEVFMPESHPPTQLKVLAWPVFSVGRFELETPADRVVERADSARLVRIVLHDDVVVGGNLIGDATLTAALRRAVQERLALAAVPELRFLTDETAI